MCNKGMTDIRLEILHYDAIQFAGATKPSGGPAIDNDEEHLKRCEK